MSPVPKKHAGGRPRVKVTPEQVKQLRDGANSWREIARALGIGTATAMRLHDARVRAGECVSKLVRGDRLITGCGRLSPDPKKARSK